MGTNSAKQTDDEELMGWGRLSEECFRMGEEVAGGTRGRERCAVVGRCKKGALCFFCAEAWLIGTAFGHDCRIPIQTHKDDDQEQQRMRHQFEAF